MKLKPLLLIHLTLMLALLGSQQSAAQRRPIAQNSRMAIAQLEEIKGTISIKRSGNSNYTLLQSPLRDKITLFWGDLLKVEPNSRAVVRCHANSVKWIVPNDGVPRGVATICS